MKKILILSPYPEGIAAGQRLKYEQYYNSWEAEGYELRKSAFFSLNTWGVLWQKGYFLRKIIGTLHGYFRRTKDLFTLHEYDVVYIFMWATPIGFPFYEWLILKSGKKVVYDFDDAVFNTSDYLSKLKGGYKSRFLIKNCHQVVLSSPFLLEHCIQTNRFSKAQYIPCSLDLQRFKLKQTSWTSKIVLGWTGTFSSKHYLDSIKETLYELDKLVDIKIILITNFDYSLEGLDYEIIRWKESSEIIDLHKIDIGLYPLIQTDWSLGKGGLKALQYMAVGIPAIATDFGTVKDFIIHKENGFLVNATEEWVDSVKLLIENPMLRKNIIINARKTVESGYSVTSNKDKYLSIFKDLLKKD
jgi:glycosyltransferase involved in cell wall biosynthesis